MSEDQPVNTVSFNAGMEQRLANTPGATTTPQTTEEKRQSIMESQRTATKFGHHEDAAKLAEALIKNKDASQ